MPTRGQIRDIGPGVSHKARVVQLYLWGLQFTEIERRTRHSEDSIRRYLFDVAINGTHPLLPWLAFLCAGMVLGRVLTTPWWRRTTAAPPR